MLQAFMLSEGKESVKEIPPEFLFCVEQVQRTDNLRRAQYQIVKTSLSTGLYYLVGLAGFEPAGCGSQSPVPYRLATAHYRNRDLAKSCPLTRIPVLLWGG